MNWKKKIISLFVAGTIVGTTAAPTALASILYSDFLDFPQHSSEYVLVRKEEHHIQTNSTTAVTYTYDIDGKLEKQTTRIQDGDTFEETYSYDANGRVSQIEGSLSNVKLTYDKRGNVIKSEDLSDPNGYALYTYDEKNNVKKIEHHMIIPAGSVTEELFDNEYDDNGNLVKVSKTWVNADGKKESNGFYTYVYDTQNRRIEYNKHAPNKNKDVTSTKYQYDINGNMVRSDVYYTGNGRGSYTIYTYKRIGEHIEPEEPVPGVTKIFNDVSNIWYAEAVQYAYDTGLMIGTSKTTFEPDLTLTRAMAVQLLYAKADRPKVSKTVSYSDIDPNEWYTKAVSWAVEKGIITGYSKTEFGIHDDITREQLAAILYIDAGRPPVTGTLGKYKDYASISSWATNAVLWATQQNIISGTEQSEQLMLNPQGCVSRAEAAAMVMQYVNK